MPCVERESHFRLRFANARKGDFSGRNACRQRAAEFAFGDDIHAGAEPGQGFENGLVGIGFHGIADQMRHAGESLIEHLVVAGERRRRIAIKRRANRRRELGEIDILGMHDAVLHREVMHGMIKAGDRAGRILAGAPGFASRRPEPAPRRWSWPRFAAAVRPYSRGVQFLLVSR